MSTQFSYDRYLCAIMLLLLLAAAEFATPTKSPALRPVDMLDRLLIN